MYHITVLQLRADLHSGAELQFPSLFMVKFARTTTTNEDVLVKKMYLRKFSTNVL